MEEQTIESAYIKQVNKIGTFDKCKCSNGFVFTLLNEHEPLTEPIEQVYLSLCAEGAIKGPHMHTGRKYDRFFCIKGQCVIVCRNEKNGKYSEFILSEFDQQLLVIPPYNSHALLALNQQPAIILSMPSEGFQIGQKYNQVETFYHDYDWSKFQ